MRKILHIFLSIVLVYATTTASYAASPSGWVVTKIVSSGSRVLINATKGGYKSAVNIAPNAGRIALSLGRTANTASLIWTVANALGDGVDYVLDPANNSIKTKLIASDLDSEGMLPGGDGICMTALTNHFGSGTDMTRNVEYRKISGEHRCYSGVNPTYNMRLTSGVDYTEVPYDQGATVPLTDLTPALITAASMGIQQAQDILQNVALESVNAGYYDTQLQAGAVPSGTNDTSTASGSASLAAGQAAADARANLDAQAAATGAAVDSFNDARDAAITAADEAQDLINSGADEAAIQVAEAASKAANTIRDVTAAAVEASIQAQAVAARDAAAASKSYAEAARAADVTAKRAAAQAATNSADATQAADDAQNDLRTLGSETTQAVRDVAEAAATTTAEAAARALKVLGTLTIGATNAEIAAGLAAVEAKEAAKEAEKAKEKAEEKVPPKPFEFPAFCTWAVPVCDAIDWIKKDPVAVAPELVPVDDAPATSDASDFDVNYVNFGGQCPVLPSFDIGVGANTFPMSFDMTPLCEIAVAIRPAIIAMSYFIGLGIVASSIRGT